MKSRSSLRKMTLLLFKKNGLLQLTPTLNSVRKIPRRLKELAKSLLDPGLSIPEQKGRLTDQLGRLFHEIAEFAIKDKLLVNGVSEQFWCKKKRILPRDTMELRADWIMNCADGGCRRCNSNTKCGQALDGCLSPRGRKRFARSWPGSVNRRHTAQLPDASVAPT